MIVCWFESRSTMLIGSGLLLAASSMRNWLPLRVKRNCVVSVPLRVSDTETVPSKDAGPARSSRAGNRKAIAIANAGIVARFKRELRNLIRRRTDSPWRTSVFRPLACHAIAWRRVVCHHESGPIPERYLCVAKTAGLPLPPHPMATEAFNPVPLVLKP